MKVLLIGDFPPPYGGIAIHLKSFSKILRELGIEYRVINVGASRKLQVQGCVGVRNEADFICKALGSLRDSDILHLHINGHNHKSWQLALLCGVIGRVKRKKCVLTIHSGMAPDYLQKQRRTWKRKLISASLRFYRRVICVNWDIRVSLNDYDGETEKYVHIPAFIFAGKETDKGTVDSTVGFGPQSFPVICSVVLFSPEYGIELLSNATRLLRKEYPELKLIIIGGGARSSRYKELEMQSGLESGLVVFDDLEHTECLRVIAESDLFVRPTYADGDSISVREALAVGTPVLASDVVSRPDGAVTFRTGDLGELTSKMKFCVSNLGYLRKGMKDKEKVSFGEQIIDLYHGL